MFIIYLFLGLVVGYVSRLLGTGIGCMLMPILLLLGNTYQTTVLIILMSAFLSSVTVAIQYYKTSTVQLSPCLMIAVPGVLFSLLGNLYLIKVIPSLTLEIAFALMMFLFADLLRIIRASNKKPIDLETCDHNKFLFRYILCGTVSGLSTSLFGIGGSVIITPILSGFLNYSIKDSIKTASFVMAATSFFGMSSAIFTNSLPYYKGLNIALGTIIGSFIGVIAIQYVRQKTIIKYNFWVFLIAGLVMLYKI